MWRLLDKSRLSCIKWLDYNIRTLMFEISIERYINMSKKQLIRAEKIKVSYGEQTILDFDEFHMYEGEKIGLVGLNGAGKTTLLKVLSGLLEPESGKVMLDCNPFFFKQFNEKWNWYDLEQSEAGKLGVSEKIWQEEVSGGENTRIRLAELFSSNSAVAFLDEPTANLDVEGRELLENKLLQIETFILVSHDRALLNSVCNKIVEISFSKLNEFYGNYDDYLMQKEERRKKEQADYEKYVAEKDRLMEVYREKKATAKSMDKKPKNVSYSEYKMRNFIGHHNPKDRALNMEKSAANVLKRIEHMDVKEKPKELPKIRPDFRLTNPPENRIIVGIEHLTFGYGDKLLYDDASLYIENKSKVAIIGNNGIGKTTLLKLIIEREKISVVPKAKIGYISQNFEQIDLNKTVLENAKEVSIQKEDVLRTILARLLLTEVDIKKLGKDLSGGERMKLAFAMLFVSDVNVLVLDEPTNYLDLPSIEAVESLLQEYEGTLIFVSHDKEFVDHIATHKISIVDGKIKPIE